MCVLGLLLPSAVNTYTYQFSQSKKTWQDAQDYCSTKNGNLVEFYEPTKVEAEMVKTAVSLDYHGEAWIGLKEEILDWTWVDGEPLLIDNWEQINNGADGHCALMISSGAWRVAQCSLKDSVICEGGEYSDCLGTSQRQQQSIMGCTFKLCLRNFNYFC